MGGGEGLAILTRPAQQAERQPEYLAHLFRLYLKEHTTITLDDLAKQLECAPDWLSLLWLCGHPGERWKDDVTRIAA